MKKLVFLLTIFISTLQLNAQIVNPTKWEFDSKQEGRNVELIFKASIEKGWHLYDTDLPEGGPIATTIIFDDSTQFEFVGKISLTTSVSREVTI